MQSVNPYPLLVAGVSGSGKTTLGQSWAQRCAAPFIEADAFHSPASVAKMRAGIALEDADRSDWLDRLVAEARARTGPSAPVLACSALKRSYRERLRAGIPGLHVVLMEVSHAVAMERVAHRPGHYMPVTLVDSQFRTLERPTDEPDTLVLDASRPNDELLTIVDQWLAPA